jgi:hypothetical protein
MPRGRESEGEAPLSNAARQARYRARHKAKQASVVVRARRPVDRRSCLQHWHDAVAELVDLQAGYAAWLDALPESLARHGDRGGAPGDHQSGPQHPGRNRTAARLRARLTPGPDGRTAEASC